MTIDTGHLYDKKKTTFFRRERTKIK